jgi:hypothetical protein
MRGDVIDTSNLPRTTQEISDQFKGALLAEGDILLSIRGTFGRVALVPDELDGANITQDSARIAPMPGIDRSFLAFMLRTPQIQSYFRQIAKGVAVRGINIRDIRPCSLPVPPLPEQLAIAQAINMQFENLHRLSAFHAKAAGKLGQLESSILAKAFRGKLVPQDPDDEPASVLLERIRAARQNTPKRGKRARSSHDNNPAPATPQARAQPERQATVTAPAKATTQPAPEPGQMALPLGLEHHDPERIQDILYGALWGLGPLELDAAVRTVAAALRDQGLVHFKKLRADGALYAAIHKAINAAVRAGYLDRPRRGHVRAVEPSARDYTTDDWRTALLAVLDGQPVDRDQAILQAAEWARDNMGLAFQRLRSDGVIASGIRSAIRSALRRGDIERVDKTRIQRRS